LFGSCNEEKTMRAMRTVWTLAAVLMMSAGTMAAQAHDWVIDKSHSEADFSVKHMGISTVHGSFRGVSGVVKFEAGNPAVWGVEATVDVNTVDTGVAQRDQALRGPEFFDVAKYPTMTFKSTGVKTSGSGYSITGNLTLHGVTKPVTLSLDPVGNEQVGMDAKSVHRGFEATTTINRQDFGLTWNGTLKSGEAVVGNDIKIELDIEAVRQ
jgi:polyisoprenoid-binding protein YceI